MARTRLDIRHKRPNIELAYDPAQNCLIEEVREIECEIQKLQERYDKNQKETHHLVILVFVWIYEKKRKRADRE